MAFVLAAAAFVAQQILAPLQNALGELMARRVDGQVFERLIDASLRSTGIGPLEDQRLLDALSEAVRTLEFAFRTPGNACAGILALVARYGQLLGCSPPSSGVVFSWPAALALVLATMVFRKRQPRRAADVRDDVGQQHGRASRDDYLRSIAMEAGAAKEIRVFGLAGWLSDRYRRSYLRWLMPVWAERRRMYFRPYLALHRDRPCGRRATIVALARAGASRAISLTALALGTQAALAALNLGQYFPEADTQTEFGMIAYDGVTTFERGVAAFHEQTVQLEPRRDADGLPRTSIRFEGVTFRYPGSDRTVLEGLDLTLPAGTLHGDRRPQRRGQDDAGEAARPPLRADRRATPRRRQSTSGRSVSTTGGAGSGSSSRTSTGTSSGGREHRLRVRRSPRRHGADPSRSPQERRPGDARAAAGRARHAAVAAIPRWCRPVGRAVAAGRHRTRPVRAREWSRDPRPGRADIGALDVRAEAAFFDRFVELTRGVTSILISHRFSSVRNADRIVMLEGGRVVEEGSHDELLALDGRYAELFRLQAQRFVDEEDEATEADDGGEGDGEDGATDAEGESDGDGEAAAEMGAELEVLEAVTPEASRSDRGGHDTTTAEPAR